MDVYLEVPRRTTISHVGSRNILLKTTCFASIIITVVLSVQANGEHLW